MPEYSLKGIKTLTTSRGYGYTCQLLSNGRVVAECEHHGTGGEVRLHWNLDKGKEAASANELEFMKYLDKLPPAVFPEHFGGGEYMWTPDLFIGELVEDFMEERYLKRVCRRHTLVQRPDTPKGSYIQFKTPYSDKLKARILDEYPDAVIINERFLPKAG